MKKALALSIGGIAAFLAYLYRSMKFEDPNDAILDEAEQLIKDYRKYDGWGSVAGVNKAQNMLRSLGDIATNNTSPMQGTRAKHLLAELRGITT